MTPETLGLASALSGRYSIDRELGSGGMAVVYLAQDVRHRRPVALKVLRPELSASLGAERFLREIEIAASLQHPGIIPLFDSGAASGLLFYVMPNLEGESLRDRLRREVQLSIADAVAIACETAAALHYAHSLGIVHRDIKPENILLTRGHALVADFGIARAVGRASSDQLTQTGLSVGTPSYMSPEQASGDRGVDQRSDIYSLGCVLYEMLAGEPPFTGSTAQAIIAKAIADPVPRVGRIRQTVSHPLEQVVGRALAKAPADRFATAAEFAAALRQAAEADQPARPRRPQRPQAWLAAVVVVLIAGAALIAQFAPGRERDRIGSVDHTQLTFSGTALGVVLSPDGRLLAYRERLNEGSANGGAIMVHDIAAGRSIEVLRDTHEIGWPAWAPDGASLLIYASSIGGRHVHTLYNVSRVGGEPRALGRRMSPRWLTTYAFSRDGALALANGRSMVTLSEDLSSTLDSFELSDEYREAAVGDWSPDGRWLLFYRWTPVDVRTIGVLSREGRKMVVLFESSREIGGVAWGSAEWLYYLRFPSSGASQAADLVRVRFNPSSGRLEGDPVVVLGGLPFAGAFSISPDGILLAYERANSTSQIWSFRLERRAGASDASTTRTQLTSGTLLPRYPEVSPDGREIAFVRRTGTGTDIFVMSASGGSPRQVTFGQAVVRGLAWSRDGRRLAYGNMTDSGPFPTVIDVTGGAPRRVGTRNTGHGGVPGQLAWSPDGGRLVYAVEGSSNLALVHLDTGSESLVLPHDTITRGVTSPLFSPEGTQLAFVWERSDGRGGLWIKDLDTGAMTHRGTPGWASLLHWGNDGTIYYRDSDGRIMGQPVSGGPPRLHALIDPQCSGVSIAADARLLVCAIEQQSTGIWLARNFDPRLR
jgi:serine/threonine-protein kinase